MAHPAVAILDEDTHQPVQDEITHVLLARLGRQDSRLPPVLDGALATRLMYRYVTTFASEPAHAAAMRQRQRTEPQRRWRQRGDAALLEQLDEIERTFHYHFADMSRLRIRGIAFPRERYWATAEALKRAYAELRHAARGREDVLTRTVVEGYGETQRPSIEDMFHQLQALAPGGTSFYDIGSGFGKVALCAYLGFGLRAAGVEYNAERAAVSVAMRDQVAWLLRRDDLHEGVTFEQGDAMAIDHYAYDYVFFYDLLTPDHSALVPRVAEALLSPRSTTRLYVTTKPHRLFGAIGQHFVPVAALDMRSTGGTLERFHVYRIDRPAAPAAGGDGDAMDIADG